METEKQEVLCNTVNGIQYNQAQWILVAITTTVKCYLYYAYT